jgi:hypothetical protein
MLPFEDRYTRQRRLVEVGPDGQRRLAEARLALAPHESSDIEREYLARAGVGHLRIDAEVTPPAFPWSEFFEFPAPLSVARGAWCALSHLRSVLMPERRES